MPGRPQDYPDSLPEVFLPGTRILSYSVQSNRTFISTFPFKVA